MNFTMVLGGVLADANGDYQRPVLFLCDDADDGTSLRREHLVPASRV